MYWFKMIRIKWKSLIFVMSISSLLIYCSLKRLEHFTYKDYRNNKFISIQPNSNKYTKLDLLHKFKINTEGCKINDLPLFDEETRHLFENDTELIYQCIPNKINITRVHETKLIFDFLNTKPLCYYRDLRRGNHDFDFVHGSFDGPIEQGIHDFKEHEFLHIACYDDSTNLSKINVDDFNATDENLIFHQYYPLIPFKEKHTSSNVPNILLLAIDSTSYLNFKRHFIRTEVFIKEKKFYELNGYNKVGSNTFPNMIPFLTGHHVNELASKDELPKIYFDSWPIIWKNYSNEGFITLFLEEMPAYGLFHYGLWGFINQTTDYQTRPYQDIIHHYHYNDYCYNDKAEFEHCLDYTFDFMNAMKKRQQKYFAYISICELPHTWSNGQHYMDVPYFEFFKNIFENNLVEETIIFFFSDHGQRFGSLRGTHTGEMENRLPFIYIYIPEGVLPDNYLDNLLINQNRLTTHFDVHATLVHLIKGEPDHSLKHGTSLFERISDNRTCSDAAIPEMYCACHQDLIVNDLDVFYTNETITKLVVKLNMISKDMRNICREFEFDQFKSIYNRTISNTDEEFGLGDSNIYIIQFYVNPGKALFETIVRSYEMDSRFEIIGEITRINRYGNQSHCVNIKLLKGYCYCNQQLK